MEKLFFPRQIFNCCLNLQNHQPQPSAEGDNMTEVCPVAVMTGSAKSEHPHPMTMRVAEKCSCLPTRGVEQDLESGISPLGIGHQGCVKLDPELVFPTLKGKH